VLTHRPSDAAEDPGVTFLSDRIQNALATAARAPDGNSLGVFGASVARQCI
jgi:hypothetical protein